MKQNLHLTQDNLKLESKEPINIEVKDGRANIILDMSKFDLFQLCERRYHYRYNLKRSLPILQKSKALDLGSLAHEGLEVYFTSLKEGLHYDDRMNKTLQKIRSMASDSEQSNIDIEEELTPLLNAIEQSCDYWRHEDEHLEILQVEQPFAYELYSDEYIRIIISGKIDLLVNKSLPGSSTSYTNLPIDHKTFSRDYPVYRLSNQFQNYCSAVKSNFLIVNRIGLQKTLKPEDKFKRIPISYDPIILQEWKENITKTILDNFIQCHANNSWKMNTTSCLKFNRLCEYYEVCDSSGEEAKKFKLENNYVQGEEWDVTKGLE